jgi:tRNA modification GTPase
LGRLLNRGATVVIAGPPNVGKSTLLNALAESSRAIVNSAPGTTRDTIEAELLMRGVPVLFVDTAGLRQPEDEIEKEGVRRTKSLLKRADLILSLTDRTKSKNLLNSAAPALSVVNKSDLRVNKTNNASVIHISAKTGEGIPLLKRKISQQLGINKISTDAPYLSTSRQHVAMVLCSDAIQRSQSLIKKHHLDIEIIAFELREALNAVDALLGKTSPDDILNSVFSSFCVGK